MGSRAGAAICPNARGFGPKAPWPCLIAQPGDLNDEQHRKAPRTNEIATFDKETHHKKFPVLE
jgi:hypothetical protein